MEGHNGHSCLLCHFIVPAFEMQGVHGLLPVCHLRQNGGGKQNQARQRQGKEELVTQIKK